MNKTRLQRSIRLSILSLALSACSGGGGGGGGSSESTAQFFDSLVEGLDYTSATHSGTTDINGSFNYKPGEDTTFKVGDIVLGTLTPSRVVSPVDILGEGALLGDSPEALNIARFLQTIDDNDTPQDGITISEETRSASIGKSINFDQSTVAWENDPDVLATINELTTNTLVSAAEARDHILAWIAASRAGEYGGTWDQENNGPYTGNWRLSVSTSGEVVFIGNYLDDDFGGVGVIDGTNGMFSVELESDGEDVATFSGVLVGTNVTGAFSGKGKYSGVDGTFSGQLLVLARTFLDLNLIDNFADLDENHVGGEAHDNTGVHMADFIMTMEGDEDTGLYDVWMIVDLYPFLGDYNYHASFYVTSMTATHIHFRGLCTSGEGFSGKISTTGDVSGDYFNLLINEPGGTFSGSILR
jgi:hypothetical protein